MLPVTNLLLPELPELDNSLNNMSLLPEEATVPDAAFGDLLTANLVELTDPVLPSGEALPLDGKPMPPEVAEDVVDAIVPDIMPTSPISLQPERVVGELVAPIAEHGIAPSMPVPGPTAAVDSVEHLPRMSPPADVDVVAGPAAARPQPLEVQLSQQHVIPTAPTAPTIAAAPPVPQEGAVMTETGSPRVMPLASTPMASSADTGSEQRENPADSAVRIPRDLLTARSLADGDNVTPRSFETIRDDAVQQFRSLQQLTPQVQQPQSVAAPAVSPSSVSAPLPTPAPLPPATETMTLLNTPVSDPAWGEQVGERVVMIANKHLQNAEIRLSPAELGPLRVQIRVDDGATNITFHATHPVTREAIEQAMPRLREMFVENGLSLGETNVNEQGIGQQADTGRDAEGNSQTDSIDDAESRNTSTTEVAAETRTRRVIDGLVDTFV